MSTNVRITVGNLEVTTPSDLEIRMTRTFNAPRELVFAAWTVPSLVKRWLLGPDGWSMPVCEIDLRVGGRYRFVWQQHDGRTMGLNGTYREIVSPERLVSKELFDEDWTGGETLASIVLSEEDRKTRLVETVVYASREARDGALKSGMADGIEAGFARLDEILASGREKVESAA